MVANDRIDLSVSPGQVHALLGENGAGKSTLMNVLYGLLQPDEGEILLDGKPARFRSPNDAIAAGIGTLGIEETGLSGLRDTRLGHSLPAFANFLASFTKLSGVLDRRRTR